MWMVFGLLAIISTFFNLYLYMKGKNYQWAQVLGLVFTSLTLVTLHSMASIVIEAEDWVSLLDVWPTLSTVLWILTLLSIGLNVLPMFLKKGKKI